MKVILDHNLSPRLARALNELFNGTHEVYSLRDKFNPAISDVDWIEALSSEGHWIVISGDRRITKNKAELAAFRNSKLIGFFLSQGLYKSRVTRQMERLLALWDTIESLANSVQGGAMFELPGTSNKVRQLKD